LGAPDVKAAGTPKIGFAVTATEQHVREGISGVSLPKFAPIERSRRCQDSYVSLMTQHNSVSFFVKKNCSTRNERESDGVPAVL
jgi:hypothetical protein